MRYLCRRAILGECEALAVREPSIPWHACGKAPAAAATAVVYREIPEYLPAGKLKSDTDAAATAATAAAESNTTEYVPPGTRHRMLICPFGIPPMKMLHVQRGETIVCLIHFFD